MNKKTRLFNVFIMIALFLSACNLPSSNPQDLASTAAAQTVEALLSATPLFTPTGLPTAVETITPIPTTLSTNTAVASATPVCNLAQFITDVTVPDGSVMTPGQTFTKKWRIKNIGVCAWNGFNMVFDSGEAMGAPATKAIAAVNPGQEVDLEMNFTAPSTAGTYRSYWRIVTNNNVLVPVANGYQGRAFYVEIKVQATSTATPTNTTTPFAVTSVSFTNSGGCNGFTATASITTNGAGTVTYRSVRSDGAIDGNTYPELVFDSAGTKQAVGFTWTTTAPGTHWIDILIITPNNQQFGRAQFTCP
jgi:hypothetical protein